MTKHRVNQASTHFSVVAFEDDLLPLPTQCFQGIAVSRNHFVQPADIGMNVVQGALYRPRIRPVKTRMLRGYLTHVFLHIAASARPTFRRTAQRLLIEEILRGGSDALKIILVISRASSRRKLAFGRIAKPVSVGLRIGQWLNRYSAGRGEEHPIRFGLSARRWAHGLSPEQLRTRTLGRTFIDGQDRLEHRPVPKQSAALIRREW